MEQSQVQCKKSALFLSAKDRQRSSKQTQCNDGKERLRRTQGYLSCCPESWMIPSPTTTSFSVSCSEEWRKWPYSYWISFAFSFFFFSMSFEHLLRILSDFLFRRKMILLGIVMKILAFAFPRTAETHPN